jgi:broad specificity phosphatase PhoE
VSEFERLAVADATLFLVRHGRTALNAAGVLRGHLDVPLDAVGRTEATALAQAFKRVPMRAVMSSPLLRARETATAIADTVGVDVIVEPGLIDRDYGPWAGTPDAEVRDQFGALDGAPGIEPSDVFAVRVASTVQALADNWAPGPLVVVAHDAVNRRVLAHLVPALGDTEDLVQSTGCWNRLHRRCSIWSAPVVGAIPGTGERG